MSAWVTAKLALRRGDREAALKSYEKALKGFPAADSTQIRAEVGVLRVSRGDYIQALDLFYRAAANGYNTESNDRVDSDWIGFADYWGDAAYLAERVLTIEELQNHVDHNLPKVSVSAPVENAFRSRMRGVLARRLMRAGRYRESGRYFDDGKICDAARQYASAIDKATSWWRLKRTRAEAWFTAAKLARNSGMKLLGFEQEPDYAIWDGDYVPYDSPENPYAAANKQSKPADPYQTEDERKRVAASKPKRDVRFQYRLTAVDHAMKSADLLPASSQAYAAVLCEATEWTINRQPKEAAQIYQRYLHHGAYVPWGRSFGRQCPQPNFAAASSWSNLSREEKHLTRHARAHPVYTSSLAIVAIGMLTSLLYYGGTRLSRKNVKND